MSGQVTEFRAFSCEGNCGNCLVFETFEEFEDYCRERDDMPDFRADVYDCRSFERQCDRCRKTTRWWA